MPFDWITYLLMHNKPHTEETKAKMRISHAEVSKRPEIIESRSRGGFASWKPEGREKHAGNISTARKKMFEQKKKLEREEQDKRNAINKAKVEAYLRGQVK